jgi:hypothetical protein
VKQKDVPSAVKEYMQKNYPEAKQLKYYTETIENSILYESTFTFKNDQYNLLFFPDGKIYEIEIVMKFDEFPVAIKEKIISDLNTRYTKYKIYLTEQVYPIEELKYEIKLRGKKTKHQSYYEVLYDKNGNFLKEEEETIKSIPSNSGF